MHMLLQSLGLLKLACRCCNGYQTCGGCTSSFHGSAPTSMAALKIEACHQDAEALLSVVAPAVTVRGSQQPAIHAALRLGMPFRFRPSSCTAVATAATAWWVSAPMFLP